MNADDPAVHAMPYQDRKTGLTVFGALQIVLGGFCALALLCMGLSTLLPKPAGAETSARMMIPGLFVYVVLAAWFITVGIGSIMARRWARALILVASWLWLVCGVFGLVFLVMIRDAMTKTMSANGQVSATAVSVIMAIMLIFLAIFYVIIPGVLVLFYGSQHVRATCERLDPVVRWTDRCPLPVLAVSLMSGSSLVFVPVSLGTYGWPVPVFGTIVYGAPGLAIVAASMLLLAYISWGVYRLDLRAWWCAVALATVWCLSSGMTFTHTRLVKFYDNMELPPKQMESVRRMAESMDPWMVPMCALWLLVLLGYLLYIRRFFQKSAAL